MKLLKGRLEYKFLTRVDSVCSEDFTTIQII